MMIRVPGLTDNGLRTMAYTEHIDLFPTLAEVAAGVTILPCPAGRSQLTTTLCTMGTAYCNMNANFVLNFPLKMQKEWRITPEK